LKKNLSEAHKGKKSAPKRGRETHKKKRRIGGEIGRSQEVRKKDL